ncbi:MAG: hypothetical protein KGH53_03515 [Candidatus Micrarchaeota archaeon]|nr:hypothetical protein [Candidatus Micrarchaeota archaeon]
MSFKNFREDVERGVVQSTTDSLKDLLSNIHVRDVNPKRRGIEVFDFVKTHGSVQIGELCGTNLMAAHVKALLNSCYLRMLDTSVDIKFGGNKHSLEAKRQLALVFDSVPKVLELHENVEKIRNQGEEGAMEIWVRIYNALMIRKTLDVATPATLKHMGMDSDSAEEKIAIHGTLVKVYAKRLGNFGVESEIAERWVDRFNRSFNKQILAPFMLNNKLIDKEDHYEIIEGPTLKAKLRDALIEMADY